MSESKDIGTSLVKVKYLFLYIYAEVNLALLDDNREQHHQYQSSGWK